MLIGRQAARGEALVLESIMAMPKTKTCAGRQKRKPLTKHYQADANRDGLL